MNVTKTVDARGLACPMPIVRARKAIDTIAVGEVMEVLATDKGAPADFRNWCLKTDQKFLALVQADGYFRMFIKKLVAETKEAGRVYPHELTNAEIAVICRSGRRSDYACQILSRNGFAHVKNIVPGMSAWTGPITKWLCQQEG